MSKSNETTDRSSILSELQHELETALEQEQSAEEWVRISFTEHVRSSEIRRIKRGLGRLEVHLAGEWMEVPKEYIPKLLQALKISTEN
jgi:hypothetical protein